MWLFFRSIWLLSFSLRSEVGIYRFVYVPFLCSFAHPIWIHFVGMHCSIHPVNVGYRIMNSANGHPKCMFLFIPQWFFMYFVFFLLLLLFDSQWSPGFCPFRLAGQWPTRKFIFPLFSGWITLHALFGLSVWCTMPGMVVTLCTTTTFCVTYFVCAMCINDIGDKMRFEPDENIACNIWPANGPMPLRQQVSQPKVILEADRRLVGRQHLSDHLLVHMHSHAVSNAPLIFRQNKHGHTRTSHIAHANCPVSTLCTGAQAHKETCITT